jgi:dsDNA-binding SOS-regulon protein
MSKNAAFRVAIVVAAASLLAISVSAVAQDKDRDEGVSFGLTANSNASLRDVGLQLYPKARLHKEKEDDSSAANLGMWGNSFGFKLVMLKYQSDDSPEKVATFYKKELAKYGKVLDCSDPANNKLESGGLTCKDDKPEPGSLILKAGTKEHQHLVGIKPDGNRSVFQLIYLESKGSKNHFD